MLSWGTIQPQCQSFAKNLWLFFLPKTGNLSNYSINISLFMFKLNFWNLCFDIWLAMYVSGHWKDSTAVRGLGTPVACYSFIFIYYSNGRPTHMPCVDTYYTSSMQLDFTTSVKSGGVVKYGGWFAKRRASIILHNTSPLGQH